MAITPWQTLQRTYVIRDPWTNTRADRVRLHDGRIIDPYYVHEYPNWAVVLPVTVAGEALLVRQYRHGIEQTHLELPGGIIDAADASPADAAARELREETGYASPQALAPVCRISANPAILNNWCWGFVAHAVAPLPNPHLDPHEQVELVRVPLAELPARIRGGEVVQALHISVMLLALRALGV